MEERRKSKRTTLESRLVLKPLGDNSDGKEVSIDIIDVSKGGIGFFCKEPLTIGNVYESYLTIWTKEVLHAFLQIARIEMKEDGFTYGASFVGMPELDMKRIEVYQTINDRD